MYILGISAHYHDSAACIVHDGEILAAAQEERFTRIKHDDTFPSNAIAYCLSEINIKASQIDYVVFYDKPFLKFERLLETYLAFAPKGFKSFTKSIPLWISGKLFQKRSILKELNQTLDSNINWKDRLLFSEHHFSHAASAFYPSPFKEAAILTMDGVGEWTTTSLAIGKDNDLRIEKEIHFPHSLGLLYSAFTYYTGFKVNSGEYKIMGLAPYGNPIYVDKIRDNLIKIKKDGSFSLDMSYFDYCTGLRMTNEKFHKLFGGDPRIPESEITQKEMDLAASIQKITEEVVIKLARNIAKNTGLKNLCLAGGVALNCVANGALIKEKIFDNIWIQPAAGDAGGAIGAALGVFYKVLKGTRKATNKSDQMKGSYLGPSFSENETIKVLDELGAIYNVYNEGVMLNIVSNSLANLKAIGWMQGRMEFGPRALGARSILADPRSAKTQKILNLKIKYRESFRPFAPSILSEEVSNWYNFDESSPYMLAVANIKKNKRLNIDKKELFGIKKLMQVRSIVPAVTHVDYSSRLQTVHKDTNRLYHSLIKNFEEITGCPILVNTSFNIRGEPIVCSPEDAFKCFMGTELDLLVIGNIVLYKEEQSKDSATDYQSSYTLD